MKPGTMYATEDGRRFTLMAYPENDHVSAPWIVADVETGATRAVTEEEIAAADELPAQVGQTWADTTGPDYTIKLAVCYRSKEGNWCWVAFDSTDDDKHRMSECALFKYYARVDGLDFEAEGKDARI